MAEPMKLKPFLRAFRPLVVLLAIPFVAVPLYFNFTSSKTSDGWLIAGYGVLAALGIATILALLLVRRWGLAYYFTAFTASFFIGAKIDNGYASLAAGIVAIISAFIYQRLNRD